jgi:hypothetical protein
MKSIVTTLALIVLASTSPASASTAISEIPPPPSVQPGDLEDDTLMFLFGENSVLLENDLGIDISVPGTYAVPADLTPAVIPAGSEISSIFLHFDPAGNSAEKVRLDATIELAVPVIGMILSSTGLDSTDDLLGPATTLYPTGTTFRQTETVSFPNEDFVTLSADRMTVTVSFLAQRGGIDSLRILVGGGDLDGDGVPDAIDNCVDDPNPMQDDQDLDGLGDVCDPFPDRPDNDLAQCEADLAECLATTPAADEDGDGEADSTDRCPGTPANAEVDGNGCSQEQFCRDVTTGVMGRGSALYRAFLACPRSDWQNDEPLSNRPKDCRFARTSKECVASGS